MRKYDFLVVGAGIFGACTSLELASRGHKVGLINPDQIPNELAASTDISKVIRMEYGTDIEYTRMAIESMKQWRKWNEEFDDIIYHEVGYLLLAGQSMETSEQEYVRASWKAVEDLGFHPERLSDELLQKRYPAFAPGRYVDGFYHKVGGYAESGKAITCLTELAKRKGASVFEGQTASIFIIEGGRIKGVKTKEGSILYADNIIICAGNFTPYLVPDLRPYMKVTGHPVFHLRPSQPDLFKSPRFAVFAGDISNCGWYGFPLHPTQGVVKVALHSKGLELDPELDERVVYEEDILQLRSFLKNSIPTLADDPIVYTRRCCYTDTLDGHFWIDNHPEIKGLTIGTGGSGHGFKMGPVVGQMIADKAEGEMHSWSDRYNWRHLDDSTLQTEEARFLKTRSLQS